jgi:CheY-like chemotaxis protein
MGLDRRTDGHPGRFLYYIELPVSSQSSGLRDAYGSGAAPESEERWLRSFSEGEFFSAYNKASDSFSDRPGSPSEMSLKDASSRQVSISVSNSRSLSKSDADPSSHPTQSDELLALSHSASVSRVLSPQDSFVELTERERSRSEGPASMSSPASMVEFSVPYDRVLLVDDVGSARKMLRQMLSTAGFGKEFVEARSGYEAIEIFKKSEADGCPVDFIFLDFAMPELNGAETVKILRNECGFTGVVVGLSAFGESDTKGMVENGANLVLTKPLKKDELIPLRRLRSMQPPAAK